MNSTTFGSDLSLTPSQEGLLRTALTSNNVNGSPQSSSNGLPHDALSYADPKRQFPGAMANGASMYTSPTQNVPGSGQLSSFDESPFLDYDNLDDGNFDFENGGDQLFGDLPGTDLNDEVEHHDKRKASNDEDDDEDGSSKRREGDDKAGKKTGQKPGRKPLTGEPTTKRKAQNRAAQRAFRERKERHLKDLETKVEDLEKASETTNHENGRLRATVDKLQVELKEYRKRLSMNVSGAGYSPPLSAAPSRKYNSNGNNSDFSFAFPKFGDLPGSYLNNGSVVKTTSPPQNGSRSTSSSNPSLPGVMRKESSNSTTATSPNPFNGALKSFNNGAPPQAVTESPKNNVYGDLEGLFSPSVLEAASRSNSTDYVSFAGGSSDSTSKKGHGSIINSPASSMSQALDSSCGTTPESSAESPGHVKFNESALNTISEEHKVQENNGGKASLCDEWAKSCGSIDVLVSPDTPKTNRVPATLDNNANPAGADMNGFDWMAQQNGGHFDPVLFGDYRDPQDSILNSTFGDYFNDAFPPFNDFASPYNTGDVASQPPKKDFMKEIEVVRNGSPKEAPILSEEQGYLGCDKLWDRVQNSEKAQSGEVDMDDLCSQLKAKAKCSGKGAVINQKDVDKILGPPPAEQVDFLKMFS